MSSSTTTGKTLLQESLSTQLSSTMHREACMKQSWSLSTTTMERPSSCTVQGVVERHLFVILLLLLFVPKEKLLFVWHLQELHRSFWKVEKQPTLHLKSPCKSMTHHFVTSLGAHMLILS